MTRVLSVTFEVAGVFGVVASPVGAGCSAVADGVGGDLCFQVVAGGEVAAAEQAAGQREEPTGIGADRWARRKEPESRISKAAPKRLSQPLRGPTRCADQAPDLILHCWGGGI
jgi:hypothetical protein